MAQPGLAGSQFPSEDALIRRLKDLERDVQQLRSANQLGAAGISAVDNGIIVGGSQTVNGPLEVNGDSTINGPQEVNGSMDVTGNADFTGNVRITGTLELPAGIIGNDALASPIFTSAGYGDAYGFAVPAGETTIASASIGVPAGYTKATVTGIGAIYLYNSAGAADFGYGRVYVDWPTGAPNWGAKIPFALGASGGSGNSSPNRLVERSGLSGGTITVRIVADSDNGVPAHAANQATINALVVFTR